MRKKTFIKLVYMISLLLIFLFASITYASIPYRSYTYNYWGQPIFAPQAYVPEIEISGTDLGVGEFNRPQDMVVSQENIIYILDSGNNRIISLNEELKFIREISKFNNNGEKDNFNNPQGFFVAMNGNIYIADTGNRRVVELTSEGKFIREIGTPETDISGIFPDNYTFIPLKVAVNTIGNIYVIARDVYDGLLEFDPTGKFRGFFGAPRVRPSLINEFWRRIQTEAQQERMAITLPIEYNNLDIDEWGLIMAVRGSGADGDTDVIRRLAFDGHDILVRLGAHPPRGDLVGGSSVFVDITVREDGMYSVLDRRRGSGSGRIFTYDGNGNLLYIFGGSGNIKGLFSTPVALANLGEKMFVLDSIDNTITLFAPTRYATAIHRAIGYSNLGAEENSREMWERVLDFNANFELAYSGIGKSLLREEKYEEAMDFFKLGQNRGGYSNAYKSYRQLIINKNFGKIISIFIFIIFAIIVCNKLKIKQRLQQKFFVEYSNDMQNKEVTATSNQLQTQKKKVLGILIKKIFLALNYSFYIIFHPFAGFWDLKHEKKGNLPAASIILLLVTVTYIFMRQYTGFIFNPLDLSRLNIIIEIASVLVPFFLWCIVNWALTTLMEGKGTLQEIFIASAFALVPIVIINIPLTILSNYMIIQEETFYSLFLSIGIIWSMGLLFFSTLVIHEYTLVKTIITSIMILLGIVVVLFLVLLFVTVINHMVHFIVGIFTELVYR